MKYIKKYNDIIGSEIIEKEQQFYFLWNTV